MYGGFNQIGRTGLLNKPSGCNQALSAIYPNDLINPYFLLSYLNHKIEDWKNFAASSRKDPNITKSDVLAFPLIYPELPEQTKIATFLTAVDEKISQLSQKQKLLRQYKKGMMQKLFSQKIRFKADDGSEFGEWEEKKLGDIGTIITGKTPSTDDTDAWQGNLLFITPTDLQGEKYICSTSRSVNVAPQQVLPKNSILFTCIASIGKMGITVKPSITNQQINSIIPDSKNNSEFIYYQLFNMTEFIKSTQANTTLPIINKTAFSKFTLNMPTLPEQTKIANFLSAIDQKIDLTTQQLEQARQWKKGLLQQMFV